MFDYSVFGCTHWGYGESQDRRKKVAKAIIKLIKKKEKQNGLA